MSAYYVPLAGGILIGLATAMLLLVNGRIAGISGILGGLLARRDGGDSMIEPAAVIGDERRAHFDDNAGGVLDKRIHRTAKV